MLIDTHTHFDLPLYDDKRADYVGRALQNGVSHVLLIGYRAAYFARLQQTKRHLQNISINGQQLQAHLAPGLHPVYIAEHCDEHLQALDEFLAVSNPIAIGEIGLDTYPTPFGNAELLDKQKHFFVSQLALAKQHDLPVILHIRKAHADAIKLIKQETFSQGGIAHSFSGGEQEAFALIRLGFKLGITGQLTNPNAKKLRRTIAAVIERFGWDYFVIETDCPDMTPLPCQHLPINEPACLPYVLAALSEFAGVDKEWLVLRLRHNSEAALQRNFING